MFTAMRSSYLYLENLKKSALHSKEAWGCSFVYSDKNELGRNTVVKEVDLT